MRVKHCQQHLQVADPEDLDCTSYYFCMDGVRTDERVVCSEGLRFNRVSGSDTWQ